MNKQRVIELLRIEKNCIKRNELNRCDRECQKCDLLQDSGELISMYDFVLAEMEKEDGTR